jgi:purine-binding chemotaxis protein CheW
MSGQLKQVISQQSKQQNGNAEAENLDDIVQLVGFIVGDEELTVPILSIQEIIKPIEFTRVPRTPDYVLGVFNLRGSVIPLIDLRIKFGLPRIKQNDDARYIVMKSNDEVAGFVIDRLTEAIRLNKTEISPAPDQGSDSNSLIDGIGRKENRILTILKVNKLLERDF